MSVEDHDNAVTTVTGLRAGKSGAQISTWARHFSLLENVQAGTGAQTEWKVCGFLVTERKM